MEQRRKGTYKRIQMDKLLEHKFKILSVIVLIGLSVFLLGKDSGTFLIWWAAIWILGCAFMPFTGMLFSGFQDKGWMFSKVLAIAISGYVVWLLVVLGILPFTSAVCLVITLLCVGINLVFAVLKRRKGQSIFHVNAGNLIFQEEILLFLLFLLWTYVAGFRPQAYGEEKFMDFGFMASMMRSTELPAADMWYSQAPVNYYYGGQYYAVYLTKLTGTQISSTYHLMRSLVAGMAFALPFSLVRQVAADYYEKFQGKRGKGPRQKAAYDGKAVKVLSVCSGLLAGVAVSLTGNMHYVIYRMILPLFGGSAADYWFPNSTRYIGHDPQTLDQTIHEFPSYSFVQGDLHAHVVNIYFVLTVLGLLYGWLVKEKKYGGKENLFQPELLTCGVFLGIFQWSNAWDFAIYYVVVCGMCFFGNLAQFQNWKQGIIASVVQWIELLVLGFLMALPFTTQFDSSMAQGVRFVKNHSAFYQLCILWGLPITLIICYLVKLALEQKKCSPLQWLAGTKKTDIFTAVLSLCALGLVIMPEIVYLRDIYEETAARSNTMFKLTYQAFMLFGICMGFILVRFLSDYRDKWVRIVGVPGLVCLLLTAGYTATAVKQWNGEVWNREGYQGLDATAFLETQFPADAPAIRWLQSHVDGNLVVLEAPGESYSDYCRVSSMTGLPTILGWYTHERLWRENMEDLNEKTEQIERIYTSADEMQVLQLLEKYQVSYIFIGQMEREKYPALNETMLRNLGTVVFEEESLVIQLD